MDTWLPGLILVLVGVLAMLGTAMNWRIVTRSGKLLNIVLGDKIARVIYFGVGIFLFAKGNEMMTDARWF